MKDSILKNIKKGIFSDFKEKPKKDKKDLVIDGKKEIRFLSWDDRNQASRIILHQKELNIVTPQKDLTTKNECRHVVYVIIDNHNAWVEVDFGSITMLNDIPALHVSAWSKANLSYFKHWLSKVFDELYIQQSDRIVIKAKGNWRSKVEEK
jgi:hypothetical protein